jgi:hypothetical protein
LLLIKPRAAALNLVTACIALFNSRYLKRAFDELQQRPTFKQLKAEIASVEKQIAAELAKRPAVKRSASKTAKAVTRRKA